MVIDTNIIKSTNTGSDKQGRDTEKPKILNTKEEKNAKKTFGKKRNQTW